MATGTPVERSLATASALYLLALGGLFAVPADTDDQGLLTPATQWSILGGLLLIPITGLLALLHLPHILQNPRLGGWRRGLWTASVLVAFPVMGPLYWVLHFRQIRRAI